QQGCAHSQAEHVMSLLSGIGDDIIDRLKNRTAMTIAAGKVAILVANEAMKLRSGEISGEQFRVRTGGHLGSSAGIILGAAAAAGVGGARIVPGSGNAGGAFPGGVLGARGGEEIGRFTAALLEPRIPQKDARNDAAKDEKPADEKPAEEKRG